MKAADALVTYPVLVIPLGARLKEHGYHLPLNNDWTMAEYFSKQVFASCPVLMAPTVEHGFYPAFMFCSRGFCTGPLAG
jgi:creatinine amidohydrolase/Fe(II)-dependent formamide hydrolase-like protein